MGMQIGTSYSNPGGISASYSNKSKAVNNILRFSKPKNRYQTKKKRLGYNFKKLSTQIMTSKTSSNAGKAVRDARGTLVTLLLKQKNGNYDEKELKSAIEHVKDMMRIAKKRKRHMEEEERAARSGSCFAEEEARVSEEEEKKEEEQQSEINTEELEELARELKRLMQESAAEMKKLADEIVSASWDDMDKKDLDNLKRKHRADELRELIEADMKYLKALFDKLAKEKQQSASAANFSSSESSSSDAARGVSLQISGMDMPVETAEAPVPAEGASVDVSV